MTRGKETHPGHGIFLFFVPLGPVLPNTLGLEVFGIWAPKNIPQVFRNAGMTGRLGLGWQILFFGKEIDFVEEIICGHQM